MREWDGRCHRCFKEAGVHIMSMYNTDLICLDCKEAEKQRPDYKEAEARDLRAYANKLRSMGMSGQADNVEAVANKLIME